MKLIIDKNNDKRFTIHYKIISDDQKIDETKYIEYGKNVRQIHFRNVIFEGVDFEYEPYIRDGILCEIGDNNQKFIFEADQDKIINKAICEPTMDINGNSLVVRALFIYDRNEKNVDNCKRKFETNLRCEILDRLEKQINELMIIKGNLDFV